MRDMDRALVRVAKRREDMAEVTAAAAEAQAETTMKNVPLPKIPEELLSATRPGATAA